MNLFRSALPVLISGILLTLIVGCSLTLGGEKTQETRFYLLEAVADTPESSLAGDEEINPVIGIGPVIFPSYLSRPQVVIRASDSQVQLAEFDHWAEPLEDNFIRILIQRCPVRSLHSSLRM